MPHGRWSQAPWRPEIGNRQEVCALAQSSLVYIFLLLQQKVEEFYPNSPIQLSISSCAAY